MSERQGSDPIDDVLQRLLRSGRFDPTAQRLASDGIDRVRSFLSGAPAPEPPAPTTPAPTTPAPTNPEGTPAESAATPVSAAGLERGARPFLTHVVPLADGTHAELRVPERLTRAEADRLAGVLAALAVDEA